METLPRIFIGKLLLSLGVLPSTHVSKCCLLLHVLRSVERLNFGDVVKGGLLLPGLELENIEKTCICK